MKYEFSLQDAVCGRASRRHEDLRKEPPRCRSCGDDCIGENYTVITHRKTSAMSPQAMSFDALHRVPICWDCEIKLMDWTQRLLDEAVPPREWREFVILPRPNARMQSFMDECAQIEAARQRAAEEKTQQEAEA